MNQSTQDFGKIQNFSQIIKNKKRQLFYNQIKSSWYLLRTNFLGLLGAFLLLIIVLIGVSHPFWVMQKGENYQPNEVPVKITPEQEKLNTIVRKIHNWKQIYLTLDDAQILNALSVIDIGLVPILQNMELALKTRFDQISDNYYRLQAILAAKRSNSEPETFEDRTADTKQEANEANEANEAIIDKSNWVPIVKNQNGLLKKDTPITVNPKHLQINDPTSYDSPPADLTNTSEYSIAGIFIKDNPNGNEINWTQKKEIGFIDPYLELVAEEYFINNKLHQVGNLLKSLPEIEYLSYHVNKIKRDSSTPAQLEKIFKRVVIKTTRVLWNAFLQASQEVNRSGELVNNFQNKIIIHPLLPNSDHPMGTDSLGRDLYSQFSYGALVALWIGILAAFVSVGLGSAYGIFSGLKGGRTDNLMMRIADVFLSLPALPLYIVLVAIIDDRSIGMIIALIALISWPGPARIIRSLVLSIKTRAYIESARIAGAKTGKLIILHILPNVLPVVLLTMTFAVNNAILTEASLSALGLTGTDPESTITSWGYMINQATKVWFSERLNWVIPPGLGILTLCLGFILVSRAIEELTNPRLRRNIN